MTTLALPSLTPASFSATFLRGWWKADANSYSDAGVTLNTNGTTTRQVNDQSGNGKTIQQGTAGNRPTWNTNQINSLPAWTFDGINDSLVSAATLPAFGDFCLFLVVKSTATAAPATVNSLVDYGGPLNGGTGFDLEQTLDDVSSLNLQSCADVAGAANELTGSAAAGAWHIVCLQRSNTTATIYIDGVQKSRYTCNATAMTAVTMRFGGGTGLGPFKGPMAEMFILNFSPSYLVRDALFAYLGTRFGLTVTRFSRPEQLRQRFFDSLYLTNPLGSADVGSGVPGGAPLIGPRIRADNTVVFSSLYPTFVINTANILAAIDAAVLAGEIGIVYDVEESNIVWGVSDAQDDANLDIIRCLALIHQSYAPTNMRCMIYHNGFGRPSYGDYFAANYISQGLNVSYYNGWVARYQRLSQRWNGASYDTENFPTRTGLDGVIIQSYPFYGATLDGDEATNRGLWVSHITGVGSDLGVAGLAKKYLTTLTPGTQQADIPLYFIFNPWFLESTPWCAKAVSHDYCLASFRAHLHNGDGVLIWGGFNASALYNYNRFTGSDSTVAHWTAINNGTFTIFIAGVGVAVGPLDLTGISS